MIAIDRNLMPMPPPAQGSTASNTSFISILTVFSFLSLSFTLYSLCNAVLHSELYLLSMHSGGWVVGGEWIEGEPYCYRQFNLFLKLWRGKQAEYVCLWGIFICVPVCLCACDAVYLHKDKVNPQIILSPCSLCYSVNVWQE